MIPYQALLFMHCLLTSECCVSYDLSILWFNKTLETVLTGEFARTLWDNDCCCFILTETFFIFTHCFSAPFPALPLVVFSLLVGIIIGWFAKLSFWHFIGFLFFCYHYSFEWEFLTSRLFLPCSSYAAQIRPHLRSPSMPPVIQSTA